MIGLNLSEYILLEGCEKVSLSRLYLTFFLLGSGQFFIGIFDHFLTFKAFMYNRFFFTQKNTIFVRIDMRC